MMIVAAGRRIYQAVLDCGLSCLLGRQRLAVPVQRTLPHVFYSEVATPCESLPDTDEC